MGVQGLWELLAPVGRRVSVEALGGKKLAIDASIWIVQFMKAMRDDKGDMIRNAHLLGFFRRICKLLYLRVKPVFVFDGATPALKRRTVIARRRQRERAQGRIRKTAEKLLLNHLRTRKLEEIAQNIGLSQLEKKGENLKTDGQSYKGDDKDYTQRSSPTRLTSVTTEDAFVQQSKTPGKLVTEAANSMLADSSIAESEEGENHLNPSDRTALIPSDESDDENNEYFMLPATQGHVDPAVLASLPASMQLNLLVQMREQQVAENRKKFQEVAQKPASFSQLQIQAYLKTVAFRRDINEVQKAAAGKGIGGIPSARIASEADREYIFSMSFQVEKQAHSANKEATIGVAQGENNVSVGSTGEEAHRNVPICIEIDQGAFGIDVRRPCLGTELDDRDGSGESDVEWEDGVAANDCRDSEIEWMDGGDGDGNCRGDSDNEKEDGSRALTSRAEGVSTGSEEIAGSSLMDIEAAELEEAIRRSLEDFGAAKPFGSCHLVIRDERDQILEKRKLSPECAVFTDNLCAPNSEDAFLVRERERKGKMIVTNWDESKANCMQEQTTPFSPETQIKVEQMHTQKVLDINMNMRVGDVGVSEVQNSHSDIMKRGETFENEQALIHLGVVQDAELETVPMCEENSDTSFPRCKGDDSYFSQQEFLQDNVHNDVEELDVSKEQREINVSAEREDLPLQQAWLHLETETGKTAETLDSVNELGEKHGEHAFVNYPEVQGVSCEKKNGRLLSMSRDHNSEQDAFQDSLLREAEELDVRKEQEAFTRREMDVSAEREELSRQQAELQAEIEAEQAAIQEGMQDERDFLLQEELELHATQRKNQRNAESVTGEMFSECQELLQMFGLPYIVAPMEAEAQCAFMDSIGLVDGVVTDDCDVFLFGGRNVFKNIFDDRKYVETYYMKDVESELGLDQEKLIHMALLLGSDYTEGISGIGIVNAVEVVNAFRGENGLRKFKDWLDAPDFSLLEKVGQKKPMRRNKRQEEVENDNHREKEEVEDCATESVAEVEDQDRKESESSDYNYQQNIFMEKHRAVSKNWNIPESFPNVVVINAYKVPQVDRSTESFSWGRPDLEALRGLCFERFGWIKSKADELLLPVLKEYDRHETQLRLEAFYTFNQRFAKIRSKRIQKAVTRITGKRSSELMDLSPNASEFSPKKKQSARHSDDKETGRFEQPLEDKIAGSKRKRARATDSCKQGRGRGRGRTSSRGRGKTLGKNARGSLLKDSAESSTGKSSSEDTLDIGKSQQRSSGIDGEQLRRSTRLSQRDTCRFSDSEKDGSGYLSQALDGETVTSSNDCSDPVGNVPNSLYQEVGGSRSSPIPLSSGVAYESRDVEKHVLANASSTQHPFGLQGQQEDSKGVIDKEEASLANNSSAQNLFGVQRQQEDTDYLVMGGGFCFADNKAQEPFESTARFSEDVDRLPEDMPASSSGVSCAKQSPSSVIEPSGEAGFALRAVPFLRRKKHRLN